MLKNAILVGTLLFSLGSAQASLIGMTINGTLQFDGGPNFFDPANGHVPAGYLNSPPLGTSVSVSDSAIEFGYEDGAHTETADFTGSQLIISDVASFEHGGGFTMIFKGAGLMGGSISPESNSFLGGVTAALVGDTLTVTAPQFEGSGKFSATFNLTTASVAVPDSGGSMVLLTVGIGTLLALRSWNSRLQKGAPASVRFSRCSSRQ